MEQLVSRWKDFREIWRIFAKFRQEHSSFVNNRQKQHALYMTTYDNVSLISHWVEKIFKKFLSKIVPFKGNYKKKLSEAYSP
jgi:hypothetical protein